MLAAPPAITATTPAPSHVAARLGFGAPRQVVLGKPDTTFHLRSGGARVRVILSAAESSNLQARGEVRLGLRVHVPERSRLGEVLVWETINGVTSLGAVIHIERTGRRPRIHWDTATINGSETHDVNRYDFTISAFNDPRPHVFRAGRNELAIAVQAISSADAAVTVLPGTFVRLLAADRPVLSITGPGSLSKVRLGKIVTVPFRLTCEHCPPASATVSLAFDPALVQAVGRSSLRLGANGRGSFSFRIVKHELGLVTISARIGAKRIAARPLVVTWT
jgi:hypothetical protein